MSISRTIQGDTLILEDSKTGDRVLIREKISGKSALIAPAGRLTAEMVHDLEDELTSILFICSKIVIDMKSVQSISNTVINSFLNVQHMVDSREGKMILIGVDDPVWEKFKALHLEEVFIIERVQQTQEIQ